MSIMSVDTNKAMTLSNEVREILSGQKAHDIIAVFALTIANTSVDMNMSFEDLMSDIDTTFVALCNKEQ